MCVEGCAKITPAQNNFRSIPHFRNAVSLWNSQPGLAAFRVRFIYLAIV